MSQFPQEITVQLDTFEIFGNLARLREHVTVINFQHFPDIVSFQVETIIIATEDAQNSDKTHTREYKKDIARPL